MSLAGEFNHIDVRDYEARHPALFAYVKEQMAQPGKQFLLVGDTNHTNEAVKTFLGSSGMAALCKYANIHHVAVELHREFAPSETMAAYVERLNDQESADFAFWESFKKNLRKKWMKKLFPEMDEGKVLENCKTIWRDRTFGYMHAGLNVINAASLQWDTTTIDGITLAERVFLGDRETAAYIKSRVNNQKAAIIYGANHFLYEEALSSHLDRKKCIHIDVYSNRLAYIDSFKDGFSYADFLPDRVFLIEENILEPPDLALYRIAKDKRWDGVQMYKKGIARLYGSHADPSEKDAAIGRITKIPGIDPQYFNYTPVTRDNRISRLLAKFF
jgi:hypothetical protein